MPTHHTSERARLAALARHRPPDDPELQVARRELRAAVLADHVREQIAIPPPLTSEQRAGIAAILTGDDR